MAKPARYIAACLLMLTLAAALCGCDNRKEYRLSGHTMGTTYSVLFVLEKGVTLDLVSKAVEHELKAVNASMSTFDPNSEISRFNAAPALQTQNEPFAVSAPFHNVMLTAQDLYQRSDGAWDGTVMPLVNLWGFGPDGFHSKPPADDAVQAALANVGFDKIAVMPDQALVKHADGVTLDLASMAKGYGVDCIAAALKGLGLKSFLVEIGGEVYASDVKLNKAKWRVGINTPVANGELNAVYAIAELSNQAMATSGNYRNYFEADGEFYTHIMDPRTGYPIKNKIASVSVVAPNCALADGLATALTVMEIEQGLKLAASYPGVEAYIIEHGPNGTFVNHLSDGMEQYVVKMPEK